MVKKFEEFVADLEANEIEEGKFKNTALGLAVAGSLAVGVHNMSHKKIVSDPEKEKIEYVEPIYRPGKDFYPSDDILEYIKRAEGWHKGWKDDGKGNRTTGWGFKITPELKKKYPNGMTKDQADKYFKDFAIPNRVKLFIKAVPSIEKYSQNQLDALFDLFYNVGYGKFTKGSPSLQVALDKCDFDAIIKEMDHDYNNKRVPGAKIRRDYERDLFMQDI